MSFSHLEKVLLLSLKERVKEARRNQNLKDAAPSPNAQLWRAVGKFYGKDDRYREGTPAIVKEEILDVVGCTDEDLSVTLYLLTREGLMEYESYYNLYTITEKGLQACRKFPLEA